MVRKSFKKHNRAIPVPPVPICINNGCQCPPGMRAVKYGCRPANSGSPALDPITQMETVFDNMMDPFMPIYKCVNFVCRGRNTNNWYAEKCRCPDKKCRAGTCIIGKKDRNLGPRRRLDNGQRIVEVPGRCSKNCDNDNSLNEFERAADNFDNRFNFNNNSLGRPVCRSNAIPLLPFPNNCRLRCQAGANNNALNEFDRQVERFDNRFTLGAFSFQQA
jgi:hypothetical protein